ncbi:uracil-DNA glycosylase-like [Pecten maximus]|uniref:uracil-DNA glycosylase-like n=1 Tax=Pecten maximus TaxID=6579 RepID=UPI001458F681|nr:uracil-DNA glycosylase-like [Pecten maximus]
MFNTAMCSPLLHQSPRLVWFPWFDLPQRKIFWTWYNNMGDAWKWALNNEFSQPYFHVLANFIDDEIYVRYRTIYPPAELVFSWTRYCSPDSVKVVILGQDPYPGPGQAHGLSFSVPDGVPIPPSLDNIYNELTTDINVNFNHPRHGSLIGWAKQGVLLLNTCLTVQHGVPESHHRQGWKIFTDAVILYLSRNCTGLVFMLWGNEAQQKTGLIYPYRDHLILKRSHPMARRNATDGGFLGCKHFSKCNEHLRFHNKTPIDWNWLPTPKNTLPIDWKRLPIDRSPVLRDWDYSGCNERFHWSRLQINWDRLPLYRPVGLDECNTGLYRLPVDWSWLSIDWTGLSIGGPVKPNTGIIAPSNPLS